MRRGWLPAAAVAAAAVAGVAVVLAGVGSGWWSGSARLSPVEAVTAAAQLSSRSIGFGDAVEARLDVVVDRRRADPAAVRATTAFAPFAARPLPVERRTVGHAVLLRYRWRLECLTEACLPQAASRSFTFPASRVVAGDTAVTATWPALEVARRTTAADDARTSPAWRSDASLPASAAAGDASLLAWLLGGGAAALLLAAGALLAYALRPGRRERRRLAGLPRALALVAESLERDDDAGRRRALESLAAVLRDGAAGDPEPLAAEAERLAWSAPPPDPAAIRELVARAAEGAA